MRQKFLFTLLLFLPLFGQSQQADFFEMTDNFMKIYVRNGQVSYASIAKNRNELNKIIQKIERVQYQFFFENLRKAYLINAYNMLVIKQIVDNYPVDSPKKIKGFFNKTPFNVGGKMMTLNELEKNIIFRQFNDARLHFALIDGADGCPPLENMAYNPRNLEAQLEKHCRKTMNETYFVRCGRGNVALSKIFAWNRNDFEADGKTILDFVNRYRDEKIPADWEIGFYEYDWTLNEIAAK